MQLLPRRAHDLNGVKECIPQPGEELALRIEEAFRAGRPGWQVGAIPGRRERRLCVPCARAVRFASGLDFELMPTTEPAEVVLPHRLALALDSRHYLAWRQLLPNDLAFGKSLQAAALRDLLDLPFESKMTESVAEVCGFGVRRAHTAVKRGRVAWHRLAAWPWWYFDHGQPPGQWADYGDALRAAFLTWESGTLLQYG